MLALLVLSLALEAYLAYLCFFLPAKAFVSMQTPYGSERALPAYLIGWFLLPLTVLLVYAIYAVARNQRRVAPLIYIMALWWVAPKTVRGIGGFLCRGRNFYLGNAIATLKIYNLQGQLVKTFSAGKQQFPKTVFVPGVYVVVVTGAMQTAKIIVAY